MNLIKTNFFPSSISRGEKNAALLWYFLWGYAFFGELLNGFSAKLHLDGSSFHILIICFLLLKSFPFLSKKIKFVDIFFWLLYCLIFAFSYINNIQNNEIQEKYASETMLLTYPYLFLGLNIELKYMYKPMTRISFIVILWYVFYCMIYQQSKIGSMQDNEIHEGMHFAYLVLPHLLMCIWDSFKEKDRLSVLGTLLGFFLLLSLGNRGSLVDVIFFIIAYLLFFVKAKQKFFLYFLSLTIGVLIYIYMDPIILYFQGLLAELGMSTRIFDILADSAFTAGTSVDERVLYQEKILNAIKDGPLYGYGFCGSWQFINSYPHNILYDLAITFGPIGAFVIVSFLVWLIYKGFRSTNSTDERVFFLLVIITGLIKLFVSYTFLNNVESFLMIGYGLMLIRKKNISE